MYNDLPYTGFGALLLTGAAVVMTAVGFVATRVSRALGRGRR